MPARTTQNRPWSARLSPAVPSSPDSDGAVDARLVERSAAGDESAFAEIIARHQGRVYGLVLNLLRNPADAEEITQDTFIRAYRGLSRFRGESSLATWLHRIALNLARNRYWYFFRRRRHRWISLDQPLRDDSATCMADLVATPQADPAQETALSEFTALVARTMERLNHRQREILAMRNLLDLSYDEIARVLGISVGTVKSRIARAREKMRELLAESLPELKSEASLSDIFRMARAGYGQPVITSA
jgi:RNA polymerase sigma-70 factor, ECF subfamily